MRLWNTLKQEECEGIVLTPEEWHNHESYHPMIGISRPTLFVQCGALVHKWNPVTPSYAMGWAIRQATDEEKALLRQNMYRMINL